MNSQRRFRLSNKEVKLLGLKAKETNNRYSLSEEQVQILLEERNGFSDETTGYRMSAKGKVMSALNDNGKVMSIEEYCVKYGLDFSTVKSYRLMNHLTPCRYSIVFHAHEQETEEIESFRDLIKRGMKAVKVRKVKQSKGRGTAVCHIGDLHLGACIEGLRVTGNYSLEILVNRLETIAEELNAGGYEKVHIHILGDLIESFTGLNHKNSFKGLDSRMIGAEAVKFAVKVLDRNFLRKINNLGEIKIIGGNHDRFNHDKDVDNEGGVANLVSWALGLQGYSVEFDSLVLNHVVDGVSYVLLHGDKGLSKRKAKEIIFDYGKQGLYNVIAEAHLHSLIVKEDSHNCVRFHVRSLFTGNGYSEELGYTSTAGYTVFIQNKKSKVPNMLNMSLN